MHSTLMFFKINILIVIFFLKRYRNYLSRNTPCGTTGICTGTSTSASYGHILKLCFFCSYRREIEMHSNCEIYDPI
jgi:hypothetical protein